MKALVLNDTPGNDTAYATELRDAGYDVVRCSPPGEAHFPCVGIDGDCPLDATVDVAVVIHEKASTGLAAGEAGVVCALRDGVPLVGAGNGAATPFGEAVDAVAAGVLDVVGACERAIGGSLIRTGRELGGRLERDGDAVHLELDGDASEADAVRAHRALRIAFPAARVIDVGGVAPPAGPLSGRTAGRGRAESAGGQRKE